MVYTSHFLVILFLNSFWQSPTNLFWNLKIVLADGNVTKWWVSSEICKNKSCILNIKKNHCLKLLPQYGLQWSNLVHLMGSCHFKKLLSIYGRNRLEKIKRRLKVFFLGRKKKTCIVHSESVSAVTHILAM